MRHMKRTARALIIVAYIILPGLASGLSLEGRVQEFDLKNGMKVLIWSGR